jgi:hypothetical protein
MRTARLGVDGLFGTTLIVSAVYMQKRARYLDALTAGQLTRSYMAAVLGELVVIDTCAVISGPERENVAHAERHPGPYDSPEQS